MKRLHYLDRKIKMKSLKHQILRLIYLMSTLSKMTKISKVIRSVIKTSSTKLKNRMTLPKITSITSSNL
jgi:uncharacterized protein (UPF0147 family)